MEFDSQGDLWIGSNGGLTVFDSQNWITYNNQKSPLPSNLLRPVMLETQGQFWIGTNGAGLVQKTLNDWKIFDTNNSDLSDDNITDLALELNGQLWVSTSSQGVMRFTP